MGKILFESVELENRFHEVVSFCDDNHIDFTVDCIGYSSFNYREYEKFDLTQFLLEEHFDDDIYITNDTEISIGLQRVFNDEDVTFGYFYEAMKVALSGEVIDNKLFVSPQLALVYIDCDLNVLEKLEEQEYSIKQLWGSTEIEVTIVIGLTSFGIRLSLDGNYDKYYPPVVNEDTFIQIRTNGEMDPLAIEDVIQSYIFELQSALSLNLQRLARITSLEYYDDDETVLDSHKRTPLRMRPLMNGKGISTVLQIYNSCNEVEDNEYRILNYTKVIEYVSQTVLRKEMLESVLKKLYSPKVLKPDATYMLELELLYDEHRNNKKDHLAIKLTVETCCDLTDIIDISPLFLKKFNELKKKRDNKELRSGCLEELASSISDTRNMISHAKTNYKLKGRECPEDQLDEFAQCLKVVANQVIRWFARQYEDSRII